MPATAPPRHDADREISSSRIFAAPPDSVFSAWMDPRGISDWWGPRGFTTTTHEMDFRPGGVWRFTMHGPDGVDYPNQVTYTAIERPRMLAYKHSGGEGHLHVRFEVTVTFTEEAGKTRMDFRMVFETAEMRNDIAMKYGAVEGLHDTLARLGEHLGRG